MKYFWTLPQLIFLALFDVVFFLNDTSAYTDVNWWCFALLHVAFVLEIVSLVLLRKLKTLPFSKKTHPIIAFMVVFLCHALCATLFSLIPNVEFKIALIANLIFIAVMLVLLGYLLLVQLYRVKKEEKKNPKPKKEKPAPPEKLDSTALEALKQTVDNNAALAGAIPADELNSLKELVGLATPYTYEELDYTEKELKKQLNLLKTLLANDDKDAIPEVIEDVKSVLASRENQIADVEKAQK
jgi:hypothetical protein